MADKNPAKAGQDAAASADDAIKAAADAPAKTDPNAPPDTAPAAEHPASVTLARLFSFWEDPVNGGKPNLRTWFAGQNETQPDSIKLLIEKGAPLLAKVLELKG